MNLSFGLRPVWTPVSATSGPCAATLRLAVAQREFVELRRAEVPMHAGEIAEAESLGAVVGVARAGLVQGVLPSAMLLLR